MRAVGKLVLIFTVLVLMGTGFFGCNTVKGVGKDIKRGGQAVENAADSVQN
ncbi:MAG: entericidin A/B family lipoprotein [Candidatus Hydrogenedentes bacterium]|nr:entericidin A/B family lipoprotein [Candidatus Hydrogenedentota bacterium]